MSTQPSAPPAASPAAPATQTNLERFYEFIEVAKKFPARFAFLAALTASHPVAAVFTDFGPPEGIALLTIFTVILQAAAIIGVYVFADHQHGNRLRGFALVSFLLFVGAFLSYLTIWLNFVEPTPRKGKERVVTGFTWVSNEARQAYQAAKEEGLNPIEEADYDPAKYWTRGSIAAIWISMILLWAGAFALLYAAITYILLYFHIPAQGPS